MSRFSQSIQTLTLLSLCACQDSALAPGAGAPPVAAKTLYGRFVASPEASPPAQWSPEPIDKDTSYPKQSELYYLSGKGKDDAVAWEFSINRGRQSGIKSTIPVPSHWEFHGFGDFQYGHTPSDEVGTYRRTFDLPPSFAGKHVFIVFEGVMTDAKVLVNGVQPGPVHQGGFYRFRYDVTDLLRARANQLEVVVSKQSGDASVNRAEREADYWSFGGIFRPVYLQATPSTAIDRVAIAASGDGALEAHVFLRNMSRAGRLTARIYDSQMKSIGEPVRIAVSAGTTQATLRGNFPQIEPWSAEAPHRYRLAVELDFEGTVVHTLRRNFGFRTVEVREGDGIYVNDTRVTLRGINRHSFWPDSGRALSSHLTLGDVQLLKSMNMNAVRNSHYPPDRHFLEHADALGLYVLDELAGWQGHYDTAVGASLIREMVTFNVNHPSIIFWLNGNEGGWNTELDAEFAKWDPQRRAVLHPWATFSGINTDHYESYESSVRLLQGKTLFLPTEFLHGLYDGGGGAGLDDYWRAMLKSPVGAGGFLWAFVDEGVRKAPDTIDTAWNAAPDGILGPYREKEGSFYTVRQVWSPVQFSERKLRSDFDGTLDVINRYDATDLNSVRFSWKLVVFDFDTPRAGHFVVSEGQVAGPTTAPGNTGKLVLGLPDDSSNAHALRLDAADRHGRHIGRWSWMLASAAQLLAARVSASSQSSGTRVEARDDDQAVVVTSGRTSFKFSTRDANLTHVVVDDQPFPLRNGPSFTVGAPRTVRVQHTRADDDYVISASSPDGSRAIEWRVHGNGWLRLAYRYSAEGEFDFHGVSFDLPKAEVKSASWLGRGPSRVWKNRRRGPWHDLWSRRNNDAITGQRWNYPEFAGYFADVSWVRLNTSAGPIEVVLESPNMFLRLFTPVNGPDPQHASMVFPPGDLSFLHGVAPIGTKFLEPEQTGPQGARHVLSGAYEGVMYLRFGNVAANGKL